MPQTFAGGRSDRDHQTVDAVANGDRALADALALTQALRRLAAARGAKPVATAADAEAMLGAFGAGPLDAMRFVEWRETFAPAPVPRRRFGSREGVRGPPSPALLRAAQAAAAWMEPGIADGPTPLRAMLAAIALLAGGGPAGTIFVPVWAAYPAVGFGDRAGLPTLRSDAADRLVDRDQPVTWPLAFLHLVAESARAGPRTLDRLEAAAAQGRGLAAGGDKRSRLPDAVDALLRVPVLTPKVLAARPSRDRAADRDGVALGIGSEGARKGGDGPGEFSGVRGVRAGDRSAERLLGARCGQGLLRQGRRLRRERGANRADALADRAGHALTANDLHAVRRSPVIDLPCAVTAGAGFVCAGPGQGRLGRLSATCAAHDCTVADREQNENPRCHPLRCVGSRASGSCQWIRPPNRSPEPLSSGEIVSGLSDPAEIVKTMLRTPIAPVSLVGTPGSPRSRA
jgi:hypothetical protein